MENLNYKFYLYSNLNKKSRGRSKNDYDLQKLFGMFSIAII